MPEAVIVATARSPIGRAGKGTLTQMRGGDLTVQTVRAVPAKVPDSLRWHDQQFGLETMCVGGGQGMAMVLERVS